MIVFFEVAELVDDDVIREFARKKKKRIGEIEIPFSRAAAPEAFRVFDRDAIVRELVELIPVGDALGNEVSCFFFIVKIRATTAYR